MRVIDKSVTELMSKSKGVQSNTMAYWWSISGASVVGFNDFSPPMWPHQQRLHWCLHLIFLADITAPINKQHIQIAVVIGLIGVGFTAC